VYWSVITMLFLPCVNHPLWYWVLQFDVAKSLCSYWVILFAGGKSFRWEWAPLIFLPTWPKLSIMTNLIFINPVKNCSFPFVDSLIVALAILSFFSIGRVLGSVIFWQFQNVGIMLWLIGVYGLIFRRLWFVRWIYYCCPLAMRLWESSKLFLSFWLRVTVGRKWFISWPIWDRKMFVLALPVSVLSILLRYRPTVCSLGITVGSSRCLFAAIRVPDVSYLIIRAVFFISLGRRWFRFVSENWKCRRYCWSVKLLFFAKIVFRWIFLRTPFLFGGWTAWPFIQPQFHCFIV
jgi:hypothetical protein